MTDIVKAKLLALANELTEARRMYALRDLEGKDVITRKQKHVANALAMIDELTDANSGSADNTAYALLFLRESIAEGKLTATYALTNDSKENDDNISGIHCTVAIHADDFVRNLLIDVAAYTRDDSDITIADWLTGEPIPDTG